MNTNANAAANANANAATLAAMLLAKSRMTGLSLNAAALGADTYARLRRVSLALLTSGYDYMRESALVAHDCDLKVAATYERKLYAAARELVVLVGEVNGVYMTSTSIVDFVKKNAITVNEITISAESAHLANLRRNAVTDEEKTALSAQIRALHLVEGNYKFTFRMPSETTFLNAMVKFLCAAVSDMSDVKTAAALLADRERLKAERRARHAAKRA